MASTNTTRTLRELARVIFTRLFGVILILVVVVAAVVAVTCLSPWRYRSKAMLLVKPAQMTVSPLESPTTMRDRLSLFVLTQRELITSQYVLASALMKLDGIKAGGQIGIHGLNWYTDDDVSKFVSENIRRISEVRKRVGVRTPGGVDATFTRTFTVFVDWPEEKSLAGDSRTVATERAQEYARHLLDAYQFRRNYLEERQRKESALFMMDKATNSAQEKLEDAQEKLNTFISTDLKGDVQLVQSMIEGIGETGYHSLRTKFQGEINKIDARRAELGTLITKINDQTEDHRKNPKHQVVVPEQLLKANDSLVKFIEAIVKLRLRLNKLNSQFTNKYKETTEIEAELTANLLNLREELDRQRVMLDQENAALESKRIRLDGIVKDDEGKIAGLATKVAEYNQLNRTVENAQKILNKAQEQYLNAQVPTVPIQVMVMDPPSRPDAVHPHRPILWVNTLIGIFAGLVLALVYAFLGDHFDHTVKSIDDVERYIDTGVLASVPKYTRRIIRAR